MKTEMMKTEMNNTHKITHEEKQNKMDNFELDLTQMKEMNPMESPAIVCGKYVCISS